MTSMTKAERARSLIRLALLATGIALIVLGAVRGEAREILHKAIIVCMECIGIG